MRLLFSRCFLAWSIAFCIFVQMTIGQHLLACSIGSKFHRTTEIASPGRAAHLLCANSLVQSCLIPTTASFLTVSSRCTSPGLLPRAPIAASRLHMTEYARVVCMHVTSVGARLSFSTCIGSCLKYHTCMWKQYAHWLYLILKRIHQPMETTSSNLNADTLLEQY